MKDFNTVIEEARSAVYVASTKIYELKMQFIETQKMIQTNQLLRKDADKTQTEEIDTTIQRYGTTLHILTTEIEFAMRTYDLLLLDLKRLQGAK
jgi:hypothetical protein